MKDAIPVDAVETRCPFCGRTIIRHDASLTILHEAPVCARFQAAAAGLGPKPEIVRVTGDRVADLLANYTERRRKRLS